MITKLKAKIIKRQLKWIIKTAFSLTYDDLSKCGIEDIIIYNSEKDTDITLSKNDMAIIVNKKMLGKRRPIHTY